LRDEESFTQDLTFGIYNLYFWYVKSMIMADQIVSFVFNSPMLVPWKVVDGVLDSDLAERMLLWQDSKPNNFRFTENDAVADVSNPRQKMYVRRIIRETFKQNGEMKSRLKGVECYWWQTTTDVNVLLRNLLSPYSERIRVPGAVVLGETG